MNNDHIPKRGPRVMHGMGKMVQQARNLEGHPVTQAIQRSQDDEIKDAKQALTELNELRKMAKMAHTANKKVMDVSILTAAFRAKLTKLPEGHLIRVEIEKMLDAYDGITNK